MASDGTESVNNKGYRLLKTRALPSRHQEGLDFKATWTSETLLIASASDGDFVHTFCGCHNGAECVHAPRHLIQFLGMHRYVHH